MTRALVIGPGGLRGAYSAGVVATLLRKFGPGYFDAVYACSAGAYTGSYFVCGQPDMIEAVWRECVHDDLLFKPKRLLSGKGPMLDLFYLNEVLQSQTYRLSVDSLFTTSTKLCMVATEKRTGLPRYFSPQTEADYFLQVRASAAIPLLHPKVTIEGNEYIDGGFSDPIPIVRALSEGHNEIVVVNNQQEFRVGTIAFAFLVLYASSTRTWNTIHPITHLRKIAREFTQLPQVRCIVPSEAVSHRWQFDRSRDRINQLVDLGIRDALTFCR